MHPTSYGGRLRDALGTAELMPFIGVYDVFSASIAARHYDALFISGFGFAASHYGLPDIGFIAWPDMLNFVERVRTVLPSHHLLVDIDDGYCDPEVACHVVSRLEQVGASAVVLEDQKRPRRCGHFAGKQLLELDEYLAKLRQVLQTRRELFVVARTDASERDEILARVEAFAEAGADAILVDGLRDPQLIGELRERVGQPLAFNQIAGGKSPPMSLGELKRLGASLIIYSTPCLFAAQQAMEEAMQELRAADGRLPTGAGDVGVPECTEVLTQNLQRRGQDACGLGGRELERAA